MDFSGLQIKCPLRWKNVFTTRDFGRGERRMRLLGIFCLALALTTMSGCFTAKFGSPPRVDELRILKPGESTPADVRDVLGEPRGQGIIRFSAYPEAGRMWYYEYGEVRGTTVHLKMLCVLFDEETYVGHLWFGSKDISS